MVGVSRGKWGILFGVVGSGRGLDGLWETLIFCWEVGRLAWGRT